MSLILAAVLACTVNTALDPSCMQTSAGISSTVTTLGPIAKQTGFDLTASRAWGNRREFDVDIPIQQRLTIANFASANGMGDLGLSFRQRAAAAPRRWDQTFGAALTLPTGALTFTNGRATFAPVYTLSYHVRPSISLIGIAEYTVPFGGTRVAFAPFTQRFDLRGRALGVTRRSIYGALEAGLSRITGDQRYTAYDVRATIGAVIHRRYNIALWYAQPFTQFTKDNVFQRAFGLRLTLQR